jgi:tetratricopeptide (TPR) repeat protein
MGPCGEQRRTRAAFTGFELGVLRRLGSDAADSSGQGLCRAVGLADGRRRTAGTVAGDRVTRGGRGAADLPPGPARDLADLLRRLQGRHALPVRQIAARAGVSRSHVSDVLRGWKIPSPEVAAALARVLGAGDGDISKVRQWAGQARELQYYQRTRPGAAGRAPHGPAAPRRGQGEAPADGPDMAFPESAPPAASGAVPTLPRELPTGVRHFTGRAEELKTLTGLLEQPGQKASGTVVISAIGGTAGVGKTALAVHWAHQVTNRFPDGQLYIDLRGYDPGRPVTAADALARFLRALGLPGQDIPPEEDERAARYRSLLAGKRMLVLLDNAREVAQVRPLLPGSSRCAVLVTSRDALPGLVARDGAIRLDLDLLPLDDAIGLLRALIGPQVDADPGVAAKLATQCARLPLALRVAAELAAARPAVPLAELTRELADLQRRLDMLDTGFDPGTAVRAVFSWSYRYLNPATARAFRLLGLHPGPAFDTYAAAALTGTGLEPARHLLASLARAHLIQPAARDRYAMHDLLRGYACELAASQDGEQEQRAALNRLFDHYLYTTAVAMDVLEPSERDRRPPIPRPATPTPPVSEPGPAGARAWLDAQRAVLVTVAAYTATRGWPSHSIRLAEIIFRYLETGGHYPEISTVCGAARDAARDSGDRAAEAAALNKMCFLDLRQGRWARAAGHLQQALALHRAVGDLTGQARALGNLGVANYLRGHYPQAADDQHQALALYRQAADQIGEARALHNLGTLELRQGDYPQAVGHLRQALALSRLTANPALQASALANLGLIDMRESRYAQAADHGHQSLTQYRQIGDPAGEAQALTVLAAVDQQQGSHEQASDRYRQALALYLKVGDPSGVAEARNGLGDLLLATGQPGHAHTQHATALQLATRIGDKYEQAHAQHGHSRACHELGDDEQARYHQRQALALYTELGVPEADQVRRALLAQHAPAQRP